MRLIFALAERTRQETNGFFDIHHDGSFDPSGIVKTVALTECGIATSGTYLRGDQNYNPPDAADPLDEILSLMVICPNVYEADRFATAAFAMAREGIYFIEQLDGFESYLINRAGQATLTTGFNRSVTVTAPQG